MPTVRPMMSFVRLAAIGGLCVAASACTTVDMSAMGSGASLGTSTADSGPNVIEKATAQLFAAFSSKGWSTHSSRKRMQSAASILLNGLEDKSLSAQPSRYMAPDAMTLDNDIRMAAGHIDQTVKAAEIFLATAAADEDVRDELVDLEQALLASRQAQKVFAEVDGEASQLIDLSLTVERLRDVTDEFGRRVRRAQNRNVAAMSGDRVVF